MYVQFCLTHCDPLDCSPPASSVHEIFQARILEWSGLPFSSPEDLLDPGIKPMSLESPALAGGFFTTDTTWEAPEEFRNATIFCQPIQRARI